MEPNMSIESKLDDLQKEFFDWKNELEYKIGWRKYTFKRVVIIVKRIYREFVELFDDATEKKSFKPRARKEFKKDLKKMAEMLNFCIK